MKFRLITLIIIVFCFASCARIVAPKGGERDTNPPVFKKSNPKTNALNFKDKEIKIEFNEYIVLDDANSKLIVSPPLKKKPEVSSKLKTLYIKGLDSLQENTTYIFDFGDAITDFTEGNHLPHFSFALSTGAEIDSMTCKGVLLNAYTQKAEAGKYVALYKSADKDYQSKNIPDYITRSDSLGRFVFSNIKAGDYSLLAYDDNNQNLIYDLPTESVGFLTQRIEARNESDSTLKDDSVFFTLAKDTVMRLESSKILNDRELSLKFSSPLTDSFSLEFHRPMLSANEYIVEKTITDSVSFVTIFATGKQIFDTVQLIAREANGFNEKIELEQKRRRANKDEKRRFKFSATANELAFFDTIALTSPCPIDDAFLPLKTQLIEGEDTTIVLFYRDANNAKKLIGDYPLKEDKKYTLFIDTAAVKDYNGDANDSIRYIFKTDSRDDYGTFILSLQSEQAMQLILSLFDIQGKQIGTDIIAKTNGDKLIFKNLKEGTYKLRAIVDENSNNKWDGNDFFSSRQAEQILYFNKRIGIRKGWEFEEEWQISLQ